MTDLENTSVVPAETKVSIVPEIVAPSTESTVRNPDKLLEHYNQAKLELAELKKYKSESEAQQSVLAQTRLKKEEQYEALMPLKIEEALKPYLEQIKQFESSKLALSSQLTESEKRDSDLQNTLKTSSLQDALYSEFTNLVGTQKGDPSLSKVDIWKLYGSDVKVDNSGKPIELAALIETIKTSPLGSKLFVSVTPVGSGTSQTKASNTKDATDKPRVVTQAMLLNPRKHNINTSDIKSGKIVVEG